MNPIEANAPDGAPRRAPRRASAGMRIGFALLLLGILVVALIGGGAPPPAEEPLVPVDNQVHIPLPPTPHKDVLEMARGIYMLESEQATFSLELLSGGGFRFSSRMRKQEPRSATGTWNLVGTRLTMVYRTVNGAPMEESMIVSNVHRGKTIELRSTGLSVPVVLTKRTMIRQR